MGALPALILNSHKIMQLAIRQCNSLSSFRKIFILKELYERQGSKSSFLLS
jgi:hypothetical protein